MKPTSDYAHFEALDIRVGKIIKVEDAATKKPTYRLTVDFGKEIGPKISCGAYRNYTPEELLGKLVLGVVNFMVKKMGPEISEVLILGIANEKGETILAVPQAQVPLGACLF